MAMHITGLIFPGDLNQAGFYHLKYLDKLDGTSRHPKYYLGANTVSSVAVGYNRLDIAAVRPSNAHSIFKPTHPLPARCGREGTQLLYASVFEPEAYGDVAGFLTGRG